MTTTITNAAALENLLNAVVEEVRTARVATDEAGANHVAHRNSSQVDLTAAADTHRAAAAVLDAAKIAEARVRAAIAVEALAPLVAQVAELGAEAERVFADAGSLAVRELDRAGIGSYRDLLGIVSAGFPGLAQRGAAFVAKVAAQ
jgi:hypothetical protein